MPSREDIAEWLREAEAALKDYENLLEGTGKRIASHDIQCLHEDFAERAARVEEMRCETCKFEWLPPGGGFKMPCPWQGSGGCFKWEEKK